MNVLAIIPARAGSKGIPRKNIKPLAGLPLFAHAHRAAQQAMPPITDLILSTDDKEFAEIGRGLGIDVPFLRPAEFATDGARTVDVVRHAVETLEASRNKTFDYLILLQPTSPFTRPRHIREAIRLLAEEEYDSVASVTPARHAHPAFMVTRQGREYRPLLEDGGRPTRRQDLPAVFFRCGNVYGLRRSLLTEQEVLLGGRATYIEIEEIDAINIDTPLDWAFAEAVINMR